MTSLIKFYEKWHFYLRFIIFLKLWKLPSNVSFSKFVNVSGDGKGGAVRISIDSFVEIKCCEYISCKASDVGGAIYLSNGEAHIVSNKFYECFTSINLDDNFGNSLCSNQTKINMTFCSIELCGPSQNECSDSSIGLQYKSHFLSNLNSSYNFGLTGGNLVTIWDCDSDSNISFCSSSHGYGDYTMAEFVHCGGYISNCNFINGSYISTILKVDQKTEISNTIFIDTNKPMENIEKMFFTKCHSNIKIQNYEISVFENIETLKINFISDRCININIKDLNCHSAPINTELYCHFLFDAIFIL